MNSDHELLVSVLKRRLLKEIHGDTLVQEYGVQGMKWGQKKEQPHIAAEAKSKTGRYVVARLFGFDRSGGALGFELWHHGKNGKSVKIGKRFGSIVKAMKRAEKDASKRIA